LRRDLFRKFPEDTILDDLVIPLEVIRRGFRVVFEDRARAYEEKWTDLKLEFRRKVRTLAGNYQVITRSLRTLLPGRPDIALNLIFHKFFRLFVPFALIMLLISSLIGPLFLRPVFFLQIAFYLLAAIGLVGVRPEKKMPAFLSLPLTFCLLNAAAFWAFVNYFLLRRLPTWK
jgi:biofilm PGA synthesis N-glycosyltransferase PgaC